MRTDAVLRPAPKDGTSRRTRAARNGKPGRYVYMVRGTTTSTGERPIHTIEEGRFARRPPMIFLRPHKNRRGPSRAQRIRWLDIDALCFVRFTVSAAMRAP